MEIRVLSLSAVALALAACAPSLGGDVDRANVAPDNIAWIGETPIYPNATIAENIAAADAFSTLAELIAQAGLEETLDGDGPYTIFAPTDDALAKVPDAVRADIGRPENADKLRNLLAAHVVPGRLFAADLMANIEAGGGTYRAKTLAGDMLSFTDGGDAILVALDGGPPVAVTKADLAQSNGMIHVIDSALLPES